MGGFIIDYPKRIRNYLKKNYYVIKSQKENYCPKCGTRTKVRDSKRRKVIDESGTEYTFSLLRFRCDNCRKLHTEIPDCIIPYKQYGQKVINDVLSGRCDYYVVDDSTVWRWKNQNTHPGCNDFELPK